MNELIKIPQRTVRNEYIFALIDEILQKTGRNLTLDYGGISSNYYCVVEMFGQQGYSVVRGNLNLSEIKEYLCGMLRGIEWMEKK